MRDGFNSLYNGHFERKGKQEDQNGDRSVLTSNFWKSSTSVEQYETFIFIARFLGINASIFIDPFYGIVHYSLINIIRPEQLLWGDQTAAGRVFFGSQAAIFLAWLFKKDDLKPEDTPVPFQIKIMLFLIVAIHMSGLFGITLPALQSKWSSHFMKVTLFCFMLAKCMNSAKKLELYYAVTTFWFMLLQIWGIQQKLGGNERMEGLGGEQLGGVNELAAVSALYFPIAVYVI